MDELRDRDSENFPEDVVRESVQEPEKEHSQGERSDDRIPIHQRVWEDLLATEFSYWKFVSKTGTT